MARRRDDPKDAALREARCLNPRPEAVADQAFTAGPEFFDARDLVQVKYEMVRRVRAEGEPVTAAAAAFGFSRPSYYQAAAAVDAGGLAALVPARPGPRRAHKLTGEVVAFARELLDADPSLRSADLAGAIAGRFGITVHPRGMSSCASRCSAGRRAAGGWAWACCKTAGSRPGCGRGTACPPRHLPSPQVRRPARRPAAASSWSRRWPRWRCPAWPRGGEPQ